VTHGSVQQAIKTLEASGQPISVRAVNRVMRNMPPFFGMSFRDLLPKLQHPHDTSKECYREVLELIDALEAARWHPGDPQLPALLSRGEKTWRTCVPRVQAATVSVDGPTVALLGPIAVQQFRQVLASATLVVRG
jgi:hypothetical protein